MQNPTNLYGVSCLTFKNDKRLITIDLPFMIYTTPDQLVNRCADIGQAFVADIAGNDVTGIRAEWYVASPDGETRSCKIEFNMNPDIMDLHMLQIQQLWASLLNVEELFKNVEPAVVYAHIEKLIADAEIARQRLRTLKMLFKEQFAIPAQ